MRNRSLVREKVRCRTPCWLMSSVTQHYDECSGAATSAVEHGSHSGFSERTELQQTDWFPASVWAGKNPWASSKQNASSKCIGLIPSRLRPYRWPSTKRLATRNHVTLTNARRFQQTLSLQQTHRPALHHFALGKLIGLQEGGWAPASIWPFRESLGCWQTPGLPETHRPRQDESACSKRIDRAVGECNYLHDLDPSRILTSFSCNYTPIFFGRTTRKLYTLVLASDC